MLSIASLWKHLGNHAGLLDHCSWHDLDSFIHITSHICDEIRLHTPPASQEPPHQLPGYIHAFLTEVLQLEDILVIQLWAGLKSFIWSLDADDLNLTDQEKRQMDVVGRKAPHVEEKIGELFHNSILSQFPINYIKHHICYIPRLPAVMFAIARLSAAVSHTSRWLCTNQRVVSVRAMVIQHPLLASVRLLYFSPHVDDIDGL